MAQNSGIFTSTGGDRAYTTLQLATFYKGMMTTGVYPSYLNELAVAVVGSTMAVSIATGGAILEGYTYNNSASTTLTHDASDPTNARIDLVILRLDLTASVRSIVLAILKGTAAGSPVAPTLTQDATTWEISLASVAIAALATTVVVTDARGYAANNLETEMWRTGTKQIFYEAGNSTTTEAAYTSVWTKDIYNSGVISVTFGLQTSLASNAATAKIYVNDIAVGTERVNATTDVVTYTEDITVVDSDEIEIYAKCVGGNTATVSVKSFKIGNRLLSYEMLAT